MSKKNREDQKSNNRSAKKKGLLLVALLDRLCDAVYNALKNGFLGHIFSCYSAEQAAFEGGFVSNVTFRSSFMSKVFRKTRGFLSKGYEESFFLTKLRELTKKLLATPLKTYGKSLFSFGVYTVLIYFIKLLVPELVTSGVETLIVGVSICIASLPLLLSSKNLAFSVGHNKFTRAIFTDVFDFREELYQIKNHKSRAITNFLLLFGMLVGLLNFIVAPLTLLFAAIALLIVVTIIITPEIGALLSLFLLPFFSFSDTPTVSLAIIVIITLFGYLIKLIRGKRIIRFELLDVLICAFILLIAFGGAFSVTPEASRDSAIISCILVAGYFLVSNLMRTQKWISHCIYAMVSSAAVVSIIGILQYVLGLVDDKWLDTAYFPNIVGRSTSTFENANYLAFYLVAVLPFALMTLSMQKRSKLKFASAIACLFILVCIVLTWSRGAWIAAILSVLTFLLIYSKKTLRWVISLLVLIPYTIFFLPKNVTSRFLSIGDIADSSTMYRFYTWKGSFRVIGDYFWSGVGYGPDAFRAVYPEYAYAGIEAAAHSHNLFLQIFINLGVGGILIFLLTMIVFAQKNFGYLKKPFNESTRVMVAAAFSAIFGMLVMGLFDYIWYNYRIFFMFWAILGLSVATVRCGEREAKKKNVTISSMDNNSVDIDLA